jgi:hypothetical protein
MKIFARKRKELIMLMTYVYYHMSLYICKIK